MDNITGRAEALFPLDGCALSPVPGHENGRNTIYVCSLGGEKKYVLRVSPPGDRTEEQYLAETEFVRYLADGGAPVADVVPSREGRLVERAEIDGKMCFISLFEYAKGMLLCDNGYRYRDGAPLEEYFFNTGKALGAIHRLSKSYSPAHRRPDYFDKYNMEYIGGLIPGSYPELLKAISERLEKFRSLPIDSGNYGLVHFDYSDGNYHIDMETGGLTVFDFDNSMYCWYMFDLANLWTHGEGWCRGESDPAKRMEFMRGYFDIILRGYRSETGVSVGMLERLPLFIDMVLIENIVDEFECAAREGELPDPEDIEDAAACLIGNIPYAGIGTER